MRIQNTYKIISNKKLCDRFWLMKFDAPALAKCVKAGQFMHIRVNDDSLQPFFRRPFSIYRAQETVDIFYEVVGKGTQILSERKMGDELDILAPLGTPFVMPPEGTKQVVMIAGGIGVAPMMVLSDALEKSGIDLILLYGGRTKGHTFDMKEFVQNGVDVHVATDDGSVGTKGRVSDLFKLINKNSDTTFLYTCGPNPMMRAVQQFARDHGLKGQAACEEIMACALGACLGCSIPTSDGYKTVCYDGPCMDLDIIDFDKLLGH